MDLIAVEYRDPLTRGVTVTRYLTPEEALATREDEDGNMTTMLFDRFLTPRGIRALVRAGVDPTVTIDGRMGLTSALHLHLEHVECVEMLLYLGANPSTVLWASPLEMEAGDKYGFALYEAYASRLPSFDILLRYASVDDLTRLFLAFEETDCDGMVFPQEFSLLDRIPVAGFPLSSVHVASVLRRLSVVTEWHNVIVREVIAFNLVMMRVNGRSHQMVEGGGESPKRRDLGRSRPYLSRYLCHEIVSFLCDKRRVTRFASL